MAEIDKVELEKKNRNIKLFPFYKMISWDLIFFYATIFLYLVQVKNLTATQIMYVDAIYNVAIMLFILLADKIVDKIGKRNSVIIGNACVSISIFIILIMTNIYHLMISYTIMAVGYSIKAVAENAMIYDSLPSCSRKGRLFSVLDGKASSYYYYIDAIASIVTGYLYVLNPNMPLILCLSFCIFSTIISFKFKDIKNTSKLQSTTSREKVTLRDTFEFIKESKRIQYLVIFYAIFSALLYVLSTLRSSIFEDLNVQAQYFGIIYAILQLVCGISAKYQNKIQNKFKNETLAVLCIPFTLSCIIIGLLGKLGPDNFIFSLILILFITQSIIKGPYRSLIVRYLNNFTNTHVRTKLATIENFAYYGVTIIFTLLCSFLLNIYSTADTFVVIGILTTFLIGVLLYLMKGRVGLKPEQYDKKDLKYSNLAKKGND